MSETATQLKPYYRLTKYSGEKPFAAGELLPTFGKYGLWADVPRFDKEIIGRTSDAAVGIGKRLLPGIIGTAESRRRKSLMDLRGDGTLTLENGVKRSPVRTNNDRTSVIESTMTGLDLLALAAYVAKHSPDSHAPHVIAPLGGLTNLSGESVILNRLKDVGNGIKVLSGRCDYDHISYGMKVRTDVRITDLPLHLATQTDELAHLGYDDAVEAVPRLYGVPDMDVLNRIWEHAMNVDRPLSAAFSVRRESALER